MTIKYKGIILAGGTGSRLFPITHGVSKQLLPVYDKPMIYYPLSVLMLAGINELLIISTREDITGYKRLFGDGASFGIDIQYAVQDNPGGIAQSFLIAENFIGDHNVALILGDNIFYGQSFSLNLNNALERNKGATIFGYHVKDPNRYGVLEINNEGSILSIEEKPKKPKSNFIVTGLYFYDNDVIKIAKSISPSSRGELEITDVNKEYLSRGELNVETLGRGFTWLDTGTHESLLEAGRFIHTIEESQGLKVACLEEIAYKKGWLSKDLLLKQAKKNINSSYGSYLLQIANNLE